MSEAAAIETIRAAVQRRAGTTLGIGDDAAILAGRPPTVVALDQLVAGVHFTEQTAHDDLGWKALAVNLSDLAAMGAIPVAATVGLVLPDRDALDLDAFYRGMDELAAVHGVTVAGGDLSSGPGLVISVAVVGQLTDGVEPLVRSAARPGDLVLVSGPLGESEAGRHVLADPELGHALDSESADALRRSHTRPEPDFAAAAILRELGILAAMDCSDGLALDCSRMAGASGCGVEIALDQVAVGAGVATVAESIDTEADLFAASAGEDYCLIAAIPPNRAADALAALPQAQIVGHFRGEPGCHITRDGAAVAIDRPGYLHEL